MLNIVVNSESRNKAYRPLARPGTPIGSGPADDSASNGLEGEPKAHTCADALHETDRSESVGWFCFSLVKVLSLAELLTVSPLFHPHSR
jgi:hypothetical protein